MPPVRGVTAKFIYHSYEPADGSGFITILLDDKVFQIPPHEPYEMTADSNGRLLDHPNFYMFQLLQVYGGIYGLVEVETERTRTGIDMNIEKAQRESQALLERNRWNHIEAWVNSQLNERVKDGKSVLPPSGFVEESIKYLNIDLEARYRIRPVGWDWKPDTTRPVVSKDASYIGDGAIGSDSDPNEEIAVLKAELEDRDRRMNKLESMVEQLLARATSSTPVIMEEGVGDMVSVGTVVEGKRKK
jgi:hypothetical protein